MKLLILLLFPSILTAQISAGLNYQTGRINKVDVNYSVRLSHKDSIFEYSIFSKFRYSENEKVINRDIRNGAGLDLRPHRTLSPFALAEYRINYFIDIKSRINALAGLKYTFLHKKNYKYSVSTAIIYEITDFVTDYPDKELMRLSFRTKLKHKLSDKFSIKFVLFYKPAVKNLSDYDIEAVVSLDFKITDKLSFLIKNEFEFWSNHPNKDLEKFQNLIVFALKYKI